MVPKGASGFFFGGKSNLVQDFCGNQILSYIFIMFWLVFVMPKDGGMSSTVTNNNLQDNINKIITPEKSDFSS